MGRYVTLMVWRVEVESYAELWRSVRRGNILIVVQVCACESVSL